MKKLSILFGALTLSLACQKLIAQTPATQPESEINSESLKSGGEIRGYISSPPGVDLLRNAIKNPDGSKTIKAGQQTPEANELNRQFCESLGAKDVTNQSDVTIGAGAIYGGVCSSSEGQRPEPKVQVLPGTGTNRIFLPAQEKKLDHQSKSDISTRSPLQINVPPINGSTPFNLQYYATDTVDFYNMPSTNKAMASLKVYENSVPYTISAEKVIGPGYGNIYVFLVCMPNTPQARTIATGCFAGGSCVTSQGMITHF